jgi:multiple sugar transport system permease protein
MASRRTVRGRQQGAGLDRVLPYLLLAPAVLLVVAVVVYPLITGIQESTRFYRYGRVLDSVGFSQYRQAWNDPLFTGAVWTTVKFVAASVFI